MHNITSNYTTRIPKSMIKNVKQLNYSKYPNNNVGDHLQNTFHTLLNQEEKRELKSLADLTCEASTKQSNRALKELIWLYHEKPV